MDEKIIDEILVRAIIEFAQKQKQKQKTNKQNEVIHYNAKTQIQTNK